MSTHGALQVLLCPLLPRCDVCLPCVWDRRASVYVCAARPARAHQSVLLGESRVVLAAGSAISHLGPVGVCVMRMFAGRTRRRHVCYVAPV
eukprot:2316345-Prymnesium_polylepis.1